MNWTQHFRKKIGVAESTLERSIRTLLNVRMETVAEHWSQGLRRRHGHTVVERWQVARRALPKMAKRMSSVYRATGNSCIKTLQNVCENINGKEWAKLRHYFQRFCLQDSDHRVSVGRCTPRRTHLFLSTAHNLPHHSGSRLGWHNTYLRASKTIFLTACHGIARPIATYLFLLLCTISTLFSTFSVYCALNSSFWNQRYP